ncbi:lytic transglycosylase domain-containing protein [Calidithermus roseus]|uniref:Soluble lytic murein transglycosylase n=1 Tax=Calidithermus roseus TaxID=1644118 RepID=A0A399EK62_9DEIN|nr:lytic transglycosylase domain-containing protein [Calidithermus roseus]RIH84338.1 Soluble lytic murein transglycosylase [Calidithermus roseus]
MRSLVLNAALVCLLCLGLGSAPVAACGAIREEMWVKTERYARRVGLEPELLGALVWVESRYCVQAVSPEGARGLGQLMPATARGLGIPPDRLHDPDWNLWGAARYLRSLWEAFGDWPRALAAYNAGPTAVRRYGGIPPFPETRRYVRDVLYVYGWLKRRGGA